MLVWSSKIPNCFERHYFCPETNIVTVWLLTGKPVELTTSLRECLQTPVALVCLVRTAPLAVKVRLRPSPMSSSLHDFTHLAQSHLNCFTLWVKFWEHQKHVELLIIQNEQDGLIRTCCFVLFLSLHAELLVSFTASASAMQVQCKCILQMHSADVFAVCSGGHFLPWTPLYGATPKGSLPASSWHRIGVSERRVPGDAAGHMDEYIAVLLRIVVNYTWNR